MECSVTYKEQVANLTYFFQISTSYCQKFDLNSLFRFFFQNISRQSLTLAKLVFFQCTFLVIVEAEFLA